MHRIARLDHVDDLLRVAVDQRHLAGVAQRHREDVVEVELVLLRRRPLVHGDQDLPRALDVLHAPFRRLRRLVLHEARHDVDFVGREFTRLAPARHARRRALVDEDLEVLRALGLGDVRRQRLAGRALPQHAMAARTTLEVDVLRMLELGHGHVRRTGRHADLRVGTRDGRRCALVLQFADRGRMLRRRIGLDAFLRRAGSFGGDPFDRHAAALVTPRIQRVGHHVGDLLVAQLRHRRHDRVEFLAVDDHFTLQSAHHHANGATGIAEQVIRLGQRREGAGQPRARFLMAGDAGYFVDLGARLQAGRGRRRAGGDFGLMYLGRTANSSRAAARARRAKGREQRQRHGNGVAWSHERDRTAHRVLLCGL